MFVSYFLFMSALKINRIRMSSEIQRINALDRTRLACLNIIIIVMRQVFFSFDFPLFNKQKSFGME